jgi:hypothetical protein
MFELRDFSAFKQHARDFLVQTKSFADKDNVELFAEEAAAAREARPPALACSASPHAEYLDQCHPDVRSRASCCALAVCGEPDGRVPCCAPACTWRARRLAF